MRYNPYINEIGPKGPEELLIARHNTVNQPQSNTGQTTNDISSYVTTTTGQHMAIDQLSSQVAGRGLDVVDKSATKLEGLVSDIIYTFPNPRRLPFVLVMNVLKNITLVPMEFTRYIGNDLTSAIGINNTVNVR